MLVEESIHITFDESITHSSPSDSIEEDTLKPRIENIGLEVNVGVWGNLPREWRYASSHPQE